MLVRLAEENWGIIGISVKEDDSLFIALNSNVSLKLY